MTTQQTVELPIVAKLHGIADFLPTSPAEDVRQAADVIKEAVEALTEARSSLKHSVGCQSHWHGLQHCDCAMKQVIARIDKLTGEKQ
jgi:hypothetical protein